MTAAVGCLLVILAGIATGIYFAGLKYVEHHSANVARALQDSGNN